MPLRLPPLNSLRIFEAAARHENFSLAARELRLTPSAVSHAMQVLEEWLGTPLFLRNPRGLRLSDAGAAYLPAITSALRELARAGDRLQDRKPNGQLAISSAFTFASRFLLPRLDKFRRHHPTIKLTLNTSRRPVDLSLDGVDVAIRMAPVEAGLPHWTLLFEETLVPVCSPRLCEDFANDAFERAPLIRVTSVTADWDKWFAQSRMTPPASAALHVDTIEMALDAAAQGLGIAIGREPLAAPLIASGQLVRVGAPMNSGTGYWMISTKMEKPEIRHFHRWLQEEIAQLTAGKIQSASRGNST